MTLEQLAALLKLLLYAGALIGGGVALAGASLRSRLGKAEELAPRWIAGGATAAMIGALAGTGLLLWQLGGFDGSTVAAVLVAPTGIALGLQLAGGALLLAARSRESRFPLRLAGATMLLASFGASGHAAAASPYSGLVAALHLLAAAWWLGSLLLLRSACACLSPGALAGLAQYFGRLALAVVGVMVASGIVLVFVLVPLKLAAWLTAYAQNLALKIAFAAGALAIATYARTRLVPRLARGVAAAPRALRRTVTLEIALIGGALAATAWLTTFHSPHEYHLGLFRAQAELQPEDGDLGPRRRTLAELLAEHRRLGKRAVNEFRLFMPAPLDSFFEIAVSQPAVPMGRAVLFEPVDAGRQARLSGFATEVPNPGCHACTLDVGRSSGNQRHHGVFGTVAAGATQVEIPAICRNEVRSGRTTNDLARTADQDGGNARAVVGRRKVVVDRAVVAGLQQKSSTGNRREQAGEIRLLVHRLGSPRMRMGSVLPTMAAFDSAILSDFLTTPDRLCRLLNFPLDAYSKI